MAVAVTWNDPRVLAQILMALVAIVGIAVGYLSQRKLHHVQAKIANYESLLTAEGMLLSVPEALRFEGIAQTDLARLLGNTSMTREEAAFLYVKFKGGARLHQVAETKDHSPYRPGEYRYSTLSVPGTRLAWNVLRNGLSDSVFKKKMDATVAVIEVQDLVDSHVLNEPRVNSLTKKVESAMQKLNTRNVIHKTNRTNIRAAINDLQEFIDEVQGLKDGQRLSSKQAQSLICAASNIIDQIRR